ncbi:MAG: NifU family protein [Patescibacteria group bacterium]|nr:NifU family protein [Patescibacteria group bacterium]MDD4304423.1 NifU family protein [Patescibacteria group bacterium]MDD4695446.1 NifU family protein [Patescibacteria group bacterium]
MNIKLDKKIEKIRKFLNSDGGDLKVLKYDEKKNILDIKLLGVCNHCPMAEMTIKGFIQEELEKDFPGIKIKRTK